MQEPVEASTGHRQPGVSPLTDAEPPTCEALGDVWTASDLLWHHDAMRTTLDIDDDLLRALLARHPGASKREAVERAIAEYLSKDAAARTIALRGSIDIQEVSAELRRDDRRT